MSEKIRAIIDAVTDKVLSYRPVDKGLAAKKTKRKLARKSASQKRLQNRDKDRG